jgi:hypothetical protein
MKDKPVQYGDDKSFRQWSSTPSAFTDRLDIRHRGLDTVIVQHGSLFEATAKKVSLKTLWCTVCKRNKHTACTGKRRMKYERGYGPCECAKCAEKRGKA